MCVSTNAVVILKIVHTVFVYLQYYNITTDNQKKFNIRVFCDVTLLLRRIMYVTPIGQRKTGRPKARWKEEVGKDARMLVIKIKK